MESVILVIHLFLALAIIGLVLLQRSEGGGLGIGGGGGLGGLASPKSTANALTKATGFCAAAFFCTSLLLGVLAGTHSRANHSILDALDNPPAAEKEAATDMQDNQGKVEENKTDTEAEKPKEEPAPSVPIAE